MQGNCVLSTYPSLFRVVFLLSLPTVVHALRLRIATFDRLFLSPLEDFVDNGSADEPCRHPPWKTYHCHLAYIPKEHPVTEAAQDGYGEYTVCLVFVVSVRVVIDRDSQTPC